MFAFTKTATSNLRQADRATSGRPSSEVNLRIALRSRYAYGLRRYLAVTLF